MLNAMQHNNDCKNIQKLYLVEKYKIVEELLYFIYYLFNFGNSLAWYNILDTHHPPKSVLFNGLYFSRSTIDFCKKKLVCDV